jgi:hypothetical protein
MTKAIPGFIRLPAVGLQSARRLAAAVALLVALALAAAGPAPAAAAGISDFRFGVVEAYAAPAAAWEMGAGWERITFRWNEIQPSGPDEWKVAPLSDDALGLELAYGRQIVGLLSNTPDWATDWGRGAGVPQGLYLPVDHPSNLWAGFVRSIVTRYAGRVDHWTIWNEPDIPSSPFMTWGGSVGDFAQMLRVAYRVAKDASPSAVIHLPGVSHYWNENWFGDLLDTLLADPQAEANGYYFDIATLHIYFRPEAVYELTAAYYASMHERGISKPIWIAEANAPPSQDPSWPVANPRFNVTLQDQASYVIQAFSLAIAAGAGRIAVYNMIDDDSDLTANPEPYGLVRLDGTRRPAFAAFQAAAAHLSGFRGGAWERRDDISLVTIDRGWRTTTVVWARTTEPQQAIVPARAPRALRVDSRGAATYIHPERGYYFIDLAGANCWPECLVGGPPVMLVEEAPTSAATAPAPSSPTPGPTEAPATPTAEPTPMTPVLPTPTPTQTPPLTPEATSEAPASPEPRRTAASQLWLLTGALGAVIALSAWLGGRRMPTDDEGR